MTEASYFGILEPKEGRLLTSAAGNNLWNTRQQAKVVRDNLFADVDRLEIVAVHRLEENNEESK